METETKHAAIPMQVPTPVAQNELIHANLHKKYPTKQVKWAPQHTLTRTDPSNTHQRLPRLTEAQQRAEPQPLR